MSLYGKEERKIVVKYLDNANTVKIQEFKRKIDTKESFHEAQPHNHLSKIPNFLCLYTFHRNPMKFDRV